MMGKFEHRMEVQELVAKDDGFGDGERERWVTIEPVMVFLEPLQGDELLVAQQVESQVTHKAKCVYFAGATPRMRLKYGTRIFNVKSVVNEFERNRFLVWKLIEVV